MIKEFAVSLLVVGCIVGAALAQESTRFVAEWDEAPSGRDYARNYPRAAVESSSPGVAILCCTPRADRGLDCEARDEWPANAGFGEASLRVASEFRLSPGSYAAYLAGPQEPIQRTMFWEMAPTTPEWDRYKQVIRQTALNMCAPAEPEPATPQQDAASPPPG